MSPVLIDVVAAVGEKKKVLGKCFVRRPKLSVQITHCELFELLDAIMRIIFSDIQCVMMMMGGRMDWKSPARHSCFLPKSDAVEDRKKKMRGL